jgi:hypothetical protein
VGPEAKIKTLNVTSFRKLLKRRKNKNDFKIYQVIDMNTMTGADSFARVGQKKSPKMNQLLEKHKDIQDGRTKRITSQAGSRSCD